MLEFEALQDIQYCRIIFLVTKFRDGFNFFILHMTKAGVARGKNEKETIKKHLSLTLGKKNSEALFK